MNRIALQLEPWGRQATKEGQVPFWSAKSRNLWTQCVFPLWTPKLNSFRLEKDHTIVFFINEWDHVQLFFLIKWSVSVYVHASVCVCVLTHTFSFGKTPDFINPSSCIRVSSKTCAELEMKSLPQVTAAKSASQAIFSICFIQIRKYANKGKRKEWT